MAIDFRGGVPLQLGSWLAQFGANLGEGFVNRRVGDLVAQNRLRDAASVAQRGGQPQVAQSLLGRYDQDRVLDAQIQERKQAQALAQQRILDSQNYTPLQSPFRVSEAYTPSKPIVQSPVALPKNALEILMRTRSSQISGALAHNAPMHNAPVQNAPGQNAPIDRVGLQQNPVQQVDPVQQNRVDQQFSPRILDHTGMLKQEIETLYDQLNRTRHPEERKFIEAQIRDASIQLHGILQPKAGYRLLGAEEKAQLGIPEHEIVQVGADGRVVFPQKPLVTQVGESTYAKKQAEGDYARYQDILKSGDSAAQQRTTIDTMLNLLNDPKFFSGFGANTVLDLRRLAESAGLADANTTGAQAMELFQKFANRQLLDSQGGHLGAQVSNADRDFIQQAGAYLGNTPAGNRFILEVSAIGADRDQRLADLARQVEQENGNRFSQSLFDQRAKAIYKDYADKIHQLTEQGRKHLSLPNGRQKQDTKQGTRTFTLNGLTYQTAE